MTSTLPEWEARERSDGFLPSLCADTVGDADYLYARIRRIRTQAHEFAEANRAEFSDPTGIERAWMHGELDRLAREIKQFTAPAVEFEAVLHSVAPALHWWRDAHGFHGHLGGDDPTPAIHAARTLRLLDHESWDHLQSWRGTIEGWPVDVMFSDWTKQK